MPPDALKAARDAVEALPSHLFDRAHTDEIAENLAPDFARFAAQRGAEADRLVRLFARVIVEGDGAFTGRAWEAALCEAERINRGAPPQTGGGDARTDDENGRLCTRPDTAAPTISPPGAAAGGGDAPRRHLTRDEVRIMGKALLASSTLIHEGELTGGGDAGERAREHASAVLYRVIEHHLAKTGEWADEDLDALRAGLAMLDSREDAEAMREALREPSEELIWKVANDSCFVNCESRGCRKSGACELLAKPVSGADRTETVAALKAACDYLSALPIPGKTTRA